MSRVSTCPEVGELQQFLLGRSSEQEGRELERHLEHCDPCLRAAQALLSEDAQGQAMRTLVPSDDGARQEAVHRLIVRLKGQRPTRLDSVSDETVAPEASSVSLPRGDTLPGAPAPAPTVAPASPSLSRADTLTGAPVPGAAVAPTSPSPLPADHTEETYDFLAPAERPDEIGRLGPYRVLKVLGAGGMGVVFKAEDPHLERLVALKAMLPALVAGASARQRFLREARSAASIKHDHIVTIHQVGEDRGAPYLAMEFLEGESLEDRLKRERKIPLQEVLRIGRETAEGLAAAHERGLIHRDVKPANIWLEGKRARVKILDFGLARAAADTAHLTQPGAIVGTPAYMAPEQIEGESVDHRADLFSLGCVLYRMATGQPPFKGASTLNILTAVGLCNPPPPRQLNPAVPAVLSDLIMQLLAKKPEDRPSSAAEAAEALETIAREPPGKAPHFQGADDRTTVEAAPVATASIASPRRRNRLWLIGAVLGGLAVVLAAAGAVVYVQTDKGLLKIETPDDDVKVVVEKGGQQIQVVDAKTGKQVSLASGEYTLRLGDDRKDIILSPDRITLTRGGTAIAVITRVGAVPADLAKTATAAPVDEAWMQTVAALPAEKQVETVAAKLKERNPGFDGQVTPTIEGGKVTGLQFATDDVSDLTPVRALRGLQMLGCTGSKPGRGKIADLTALEGLSLAYLYCSRNRISDLTPIKRMSMNRLACADMPISDLSLLKGMPLQQLDISGTKVGELSPLKGMNLFHLECQRTQVADLAPLRGMALSYLDCSGTRVSDLAPLAGMPLSTLGCSQTLVADLAPLKGMPLTGLVCESAPVSDLAPLKGMALTNLEANYTKIKDLSPLKGMALNYMACSGTQVIDLTPLQGMPLKEVWCDLKSDRDAELLRSIRTIEKINGMPAAQFWKETAPHPAPPVDEAWIKSVAALPAEKQVEAVAAKLKERNPGFDGQVTPTLEGGKVTGLKFATDDVTDLTPVRALAGLRLLRCKGSAPGRGQVPDLTALEGMSLALLSCSQNKVSDLSPLKHMPLNTLEISGTQVCDLSPLKGLALSYLDCSKTRVADLSPLKGMPLSLLDCSGTRVADLAPLEGMLLTTLSCNDTTVADLSPLKGMPLRELLLFKAPVSDLSPLKDMPLFNLGVSSTKVRDFSPLRGMDLKFLQCERTPVADLTPIKGMPLKEIWCDVKSQRDAEVLQSIQTLEKINGQSPAAFWK